MHWTIRECYNRRQLCWSQQVVCGRVADPPSAPFLPLRWPWWTGGTSSGSRCRHWAPGQEGLHPSHPGSQCWARSDCGHPARPQCWHWGSVRPYEGHRSLLSLLWREAGGWWWRRLVCRPSIYLHALVCPTILSCACVFAAGLCAHSNLYSQTEDTGTCTLYICTVHV